MTTDNIVFEGILEVCDQSMNLVLSSTKEKKMENGKIIENLIGYNFFRGENICFISPNLNNQIHLNKILC